MLKLAVSLLAFFISIVHSTPVTSDPCLYAKCPNGEICIKSIDGYSYNCLRENQYTSVYDGIKSNIEFGAKSKQTVTNYPVNYYEKYMSFSPCLSSPCGPNQICRNLPDNKFVCVNELVAFSDRSALQPIAAQQQLKQDVWANLQTIFNRNTIRPLNAIKALRAPASQNLRDDDYEAISEETIQKELGKICDGQVEGTKLQNPLRISQYIICLEDTFMIRNCQRGYVFNTITNKCDSTVGIPNEHLRGSNPCMNNSTFVQLDKFDYGCECPPGFTGKNCEKEDICQPEFCGMNGVCLSIGFETPVSHMCWCDNGLKIGLSCEDEVTLQENPCMNLNVDKKLFYQMPKYPSIYVECGEENKPILKTCMYPLVFSQRLQECDWDNLD